MHHAPACARPGRARPVGLLTALVAIVLGALALAAAPSLAAPAQPAPAPPPDPAAAPPAAATAPQVRPLRMGTRGAAVRRLQRELRRHGVRLRADGIFGRVTRAAVRRVQRKLGLKVTGVADRRLIEELGLVPAAEPAPVPDAADPVATAPSEPGTGAAAAATTSAEEPAGRTDVVEFARTLLGIPYRSAGADRSGFDCSGLVRYVFDRFGIEMPRSAHEQFAAFPKVPRAELRPGDVVFFNGLGHDGIYIGEGRFIHSSKPGDVVKVSRMDLDWYVNRYEGAVRPR